MKIFSENVGVGGKVPVSSRRRPCTGGDGAVLRAGGVPQHLPVAAPRVAQALQVALVRSRAHGAAGSLPRGEA